MVRCMANASKSKGDRAELEAVRFLLDACGDLCLPKSQRMLGAGRAEDVGDLHVFADVAVQVRSYKAAHLGKAIRSSALDSVAQALNGDRPYALGMVPVPGARVGTVRWLACVAAEPSAWPGGSEAVPIEPIEFALVSRLVTWLRDDVGPHGFMAYPRDQRVGLLGGGETARVLVAPIEAWIETYRAETAPARQLHVVAQQG